MTTLKALSDFLNTVAPYDTQCPWDNSGLLVGDPEGQVQCAAFALDLTNDTLKQAIAGLCALPRRTCRNQRPHAVGLCAGRRQRCAV